MLSLSLTSKTDHHLKIKHILFKFSQDQMKNFVKCLHCGRSFAKVCRQMPGMMLLMLTIYTSKNKHFFDVTDYFVCLLLLFFFSTEILVKVF